MPVALREGAVEAPAPEVEGEGSSWERSRPRVFLGAALDLVCVRSEESSSARRASFSAFFRARSCFFCSASSLGSLHRVSGKGERE